MQFRHGDVMLEQVASIPGNRNKLGHCVLAHGEITGHSHRIKTREHADLFETSDGLFLCVHQPAMLIHEEHDAIQLPPGNYRVWRQREYSPEEIRIIRD